VVHSSPIWYLNMRTVTILGISCSTRMIGCAVYTSNQLVDYSIRLHKQKWSSTKKDMFLSTIQSFVQIYTITDIALAIPHSYYQTSECKELIESIEEFAISTGLVIAKYSMADIYHAFGNRVKPTRASLIKRMVLFYEELERYELKEFQNKHKYYIKLFEAVACGSIHMLAVQEKQG